MASIFGEAEALAAARRPFVLCTVACTERSAPRNAGARMLVREDGTIAGTVGGGALEFMVLREAKALLAEGVATTRLVQAELTPQGNTGMRCGGEATIMLDVWRPAPRAVVFGAGHVGLKIVEAARVAGWDVLCADSRPERLAMLPAGVPARQVDPARVDEALQGVGENDFVVIVTHGHALDEAVLVAAAKTKARYIGCIGSRGKVARLFKARREADGVDFFADERVHAPMGLDLGGKEPGEIAISVVAELLAFRDGKKALHRRLTRDEKVEPEPAGAA